MQTFFSIKITIQSITQTTHFLKGVVANFSFHFLKLDIYFCPFFLSDAISFLDFSYVPLVGTIVIRLAMPFYIFKCVIMNLELIDINVVDVPKYIPDFLQIKYSNIPNAGLGIFTNKGVKAGTFLGNYMGEIIKDEQNINESSAYIFNSNRFIIDAYDIEKSNYTRFINCSSSNEDEKENVMVIRYASKNTNSSVFTTKNGKQIDIEGYIFFFAKRHIEEGEELLFNYGDSYRKKLSIA